MSYSNIKILKNKKSNAAAALALLLVVTMATSLIACTPVSAQLNYTKAFLSVSPNPIGLNQVLLVNAWVSPQPPLESPTSFNGRPRHNYTFTFTKPNGDKINIGPLDTFGEGTAWFTQKVDQLGTWSLYFYWPGDELFGPCDATVSFVVQQNPIPSWPTTPVPTGFWNYPVNLNNREWSSISGNWYMISYNNSNSWQMSGGFNPYTTAPSSSHILWEKTSGMGGIIGGDYGSLYASQGSFSPPVIMDGYLYYNVPTGFVCVNLATGEQVYNTSGSFNIGVAVPGSNYELRNIGGTTYTRYNAYTGAQTQQLTGATAGYLNWAAWDGQRMWAVVKESYIYCWNSSKVVGTNWTSGVVWNSTTGLRTGGHLRTDGDVIVCAGVSEGSVAAGPANISSIGIAFNATTGALLWKIVRPYVMATECCVGYGKLYQASISTGQIKAFDLLTGAEVWSKDLPYPWGTFSDYSPTTAYGHLYWCTYSGDVFCINPADGSTIWKYNSGNAGMETPYATWPFWQGCTIAEGKVYASTTEHSPTQPHMRGTRLYCLDANNGNLIWSLSGSMANLAVANGYLVGVNEMDANIYCFAKGQTETSVTAAPDVVTKGSSVVIKGTVMDMSPAQPNTPAMSDQDMDAWMDYLHMQVPLPTGTTTYPYYANGTPTSFAGKGVDVLLIATDSTGASTTIGTATSDALGFYSIMWTPPSTGAYKIVASFAGTNSYFASAAETAIGVSAAPSASPSGSITPSPSGSISASPSPTSAPPPEQQPSVDIYIAIAAVIIIIVIVAAYFVMRRRK